MIDTVFYEFCLSRTLGNSVRSFISFIYIIISLFVYSLIDEDDPLANLLADKEDLSSSQKNLVAVKDKRSIIDDLFNKRISNESLSSSKPDDREGSTSALNAMGIEKPKASDDKAKKLSLMQDLFGDTAQSKESISKKSVQLESEMAQSAAEVSKTQSQHSTYAPTAFGMREPRRGKRTSEIINDPLGLFSLGTTSSQAEQTVNINVNSNKFTYLKCSILIFYFVFYSLIILF